MRGGGGTGEEGTQRRETGKREGVVWGGLCGIYANDEGSKHSINNNIAHKGKLIKRA